jgi:hypothetical protein
MADLTELAARCEAETKADHGLNCAIAVAMGWTRIGMNGWDSPNLMRWDAPPNYTGSLDAAMMLVPAPDWEWSLEIETDSEGQMFARCAMGDPMRFRDCEAKTPALALCAAALRARASGMETGTAETVEQGSVAKP